MYPRGTCSSVEEVECLVHIRQKFLFFLLKHSYEYTQTDSYFLIFNFRMCNDFDFFFSHLHFRCVYASLKEALSVR